MPGLELWGHTWRWASDDLPLVSGLSALLYLTWVLLLLFYSADLDRTVTSKCATAQYSALISLLGGTMGLQFLNSAAMVVVCLRGSIWETDKRRGVRWLLPMDWALWLLVFGLTLWGTQLIATKDPGCLAGRVDNFIDVDPSNIVTIIVIYCWVVLALQVVVWTVTYRVFPKLDDPDDIVKRKEYFDRLMCGCLSSIFRGSDEPQAGDNDMQVVLSMDETSVEEALIEFIGKQANMTFSDLVCAILLVAYHQSNQRRQQAELLQGVASILHLPVSDLAHDTAERGDVGVPSTFLTPPSLPPSTRLMQARDSTARRYEEVEAESIIEAAHYAKFAVAAYGAKLYIYTSKTGCCGGALHLYGLSAMRRMRRLKQRDIEEQRGEGKGVDFLEKEAILKYSRISEHDLVYVSQLNQAKGMLPYFIALDQESQSVVLCIRGTMSLSDCLTDALFNPVSIRDWLRSESEAQLETGAASSQSGREGPYAHNGILKAARAILADLEEHHLLESLLHDRASFAIHREGGFVGGESSLSGQKRSISEPLPEGGSLVGRARDGSGFSDALSPNGSTTAQGASVRRLSQNAKFKGTIYTRNTSSTALAAEAQPGSPSSRQDTGSSMRRMGSFMGLKGSRTPRRRVSLAKMASFAERMAQRRWRLVVTGHSLGAGVASLIALKLKPRFPNLHCWAYAAPGGLMSRSIAETMTSYCTAVAIGKDWVPRATLANAHRLRDELMLVSTHCRLPKTAVFWGGMCGCFNARRKGNLFYSAQDLPEQPKEVWERYCRETRDVHIPALEPGMDFIAPGRVLFFRPEKDEGKESKERTALTPVWLPPGELQTEGLLVSKRCMADHMPHFVLAVIKRTARQVAAAENLFDAPLECDDLLPSVVSQPSAAADVDSKTSSKLTSTLLTSWLGKSFRGSSTLSARTLSAGAPSTPPSTRSNPQTEPSRSESISPKAVRSDGPATDAGQMSSPFSAAAYGCMTVASAVGTDPAAVRLEGCAEMREAAGEEA